LLVRNVNFNNGNMNNNNKDNNNYAWCVSGEQDALDLFARESLSAVSAVPQA
jgi:hypothetical protein